LLPDANSGMDVPVKLYFSPTSPFVRKVHILAIETGLVEQIDLITDHPFAEDSTVRERNPLGKVPALVLESGETLFDSPVICEYLDSLHDGEPLFPRSGHRRWSALRYQALGDGIMEATLLRRLEMLRPSKEQSHAWIERQQAALRRSLGVLESEVSSLGDSFDIGAIAIVCALGYLDLRYRDLEWRRRHPELAHWMTHHAPRPSVKSTIPPRVRSETLRR
jgi:glutathione S-transferase